MLTWKVAPQPALANTLQLIPQRAEELAWTASQLPSSRFSGDADRKKTRKCRDTGMRFGVFTLMDSVGILLGLPGIRYPINYRERVGEFSVLT